MPQDFRCPVLYFWKVFRLIFKPAGRFPDFIVNSERFTTKSFLIKLFLKVYMEPGVYLYKGKLFKLEDTSEGAHFESLDGDYWFSRVAVPYTFQGKKCLDLKVEIFFAKPEEVKKVKIVAGQVDEGKK